jgi:hypothetical protein
MLEAFIEISTLIVALVLLVGDGLSPALSSLTDGSLASFLVIKSPYE